MKSKLLIVSLLMSGAAITATAQTKEKYTSEKVGDNIFISVGVGAQVRTADQTFDNFGDAINPKVSVSLGKWFTPVWGLRGQVAGWKTTMFSDYNNGTLTGTGADTKQVFGKEREYNKNYIGLHADALLNLSNWIAGYNPDRLFNLSFFAGPGLNFVKGYKNEKIEVNGTNWERKYKAEGVKALINGSIGLLGQFNVNQNWDINLEVRGELGAAPYTTIANSYTDGAISAQVGASYTFGGKKFMPVGARVDVDALNNEINKYRSALAEAEAELAACRNALANVKPVTTEVVKEIEVAGPRAIFFQIGKSNIDDYGMVNIQLAAKIIKANPNKKYKVAGYADKATGSVSWNQKLSEKRAQNVYDALVKEGVNGSQLELVGFGGTANMFGQNKLNRVVILE